MKKPLLIITAAILCATLRASVPAVVDSLHNALRPGDRFEMAVCAEPVRAGEAGRGRVWHIPSELSDAGHRVAYLATGDTIVGLEYPDYITYTVRGDSLLLNSIENRVTRVDYTRGPLLLRYPMAYGDSMAASTLGRGLYGKRLHIGRAGLSEAVADGVGMLTDGNDTLRNVLRMRQRHAYLQMMSPDSMAVTSWLAAPCGNDSLPLFIEERLLWYSPGSRYPVMERRTVTVVAGGDSLGTAVTSLLYMPELQVTDLADDVPNRLLRAAAEGGARSDAGVADDATDGFPVHADAVMSPDGRSVTVTYTLAAGCDVVLGLFDPLGRSLASLTRLDAEPGTHTECLALQPGHGGNLMLSVWAGNANRTFKVRTE